MSVAMAMRVRPYCSISITSPPPVCSRRRLQERLAWNIADGSGDGRKEDSIELTLLNTALVLMPAYVYRLCMSYSSYILVQIIT